MKETRVVNRHHDRYDVYIGRGTIWGNEFEIGKDGTRSEVIQKYRMKLVRNPELMARVHELYGQTLGCSCKPKACHGDVLVELANSTRLFE